MLPVSAPVGMILAVDRPPEYIPSPTRSPGPVHSPLQLILVTGTQETGFPIAPVSRFFSALFPDSPESGNASGRKTRKPVSGSA